MAAWQPRDANSSIIASTAGLIMLFPILRSLLTTTRVHQTLESRLSFLSGHPASHPPCHPFVVLGKRNGESLWGYIRWHTSTDKLRGHLHVPLFRCCMQPQLWTVNFRKEQKREVHWEIKIKSWTRLVSLGRLGQDLRIPLTVALRRSTASPGADFVWMETRKLLHLEFDNLG